ncbi:hypothetical protein BJ508DRAFT_328294 [Ascobolus immersus RN42]|uniref:Uncharacterized protein n=1 Tax=Ascobolus immersus RN42 TaxID=1160509 RepID=A0A3N4ICF8_ASCIM|nr:hypothetical protein BJ508DRAFT_328294 [Ascobolus immersus RN42]
MPKDQPRRASGTISLRKTGSKRATRSTPNQIVLEDVQSAKVGQVKLEDLLRRYTHDLVDKKKSQDLAILGTNIEPGPGNSSEKKGRTKLNRKGKELQECACCKGPIHGLGKDAKDAKPTFCEQEYTVELRDLDGNPRLGETHQKICQSTAVCYLCRTLYNASEDPDKDELKCNFNTCVVEDGQLQAEDLEMNLPVDYAGLIELLKRHREASTSCVLRRLRQQSGNDESSLPHVFQPSSEVLSTTEDGVKCDCCGGTLEKGDSYRECVTLYKDKSGNKTKCRKKRCLLECLELPSDNEERITTGRGRCSQKGYIPLCNWAKESKSGRCQARYFSGITSTERRVKELQARDGNELIYSGSDRTSIDSQFEAAGDAA